MNRSARVWAAAAALFLSLACAVLANGSLDDVLVENSLVKLTRGDYEADLQRVPPEKRNAFASDPKRLTTLLNNMLIAKTLAAQARQEGIDRDPLVSRWVALESDRVLAQAEMRHFEEAAGAQFDARQADFLLKAREKYTLNKDQYQMPEQVRASHILFAIKDKDADAALAAAKEARAKLVAGADFATLARELSDDATTKSLGGDMGWFGKAQTEPALFEAADDLKKVGDISEPVLTSYGYHLVRLEDRRPPRPRSFDEVKDEIMAGLRAGYVKEQSNAKLAAISDDRTMKIDQQAVDGLVYRVDTEQFKQALPKPEGAPTGRP